MASNNPPLDAVNERDPDREGAPQTAIDLSHADDTDDEDVDADGEDETLFIPAPLSNPPVAHRLSTELYNTLEELEIDLHDFAASAGFCVIRKRSCNKVKDFGFTRYDYECQRGPIRASEAHSRELFTTKRGCPWRASAKSRIANDCKWSFEIQPGHEHHENHAGDGFNSNPVLSVEHKAFIATFTDRIGISNREVATSLRTQFPGVVFTMRQIRNFRYRLRKKAMAGYSPFQATMKLLDDEAVSYKVKWARAQEDGDNNAEKKPVGLFWTYEWCKKQWAQGYWVQMYDNTYKTNNKGLAFFQIVGLNNLGMAYSCGFGLIDNERQEGFDWLMKQVDRTRQSINAKPPVITITDYGKAMRAAVAKVYPMAKPQICVFHLNKNVTLHIKRKWNKEAAIAVAEAPGQPQPRSQVEDENQLDVAQVERVVDRAGRGPDNGAQRTPDAVEHSMAGLYKLWEAVVYSHTVDNFNTAWPRLKAFFSLQKAILDYIEETWMPVVEEWAGCYINQALNFGQRTTSPVESINRYLKSFVVNGNSTVLAVVRQSCRMVESMEQRIRDATLKDQNTLKRTYLGQVWLGKTPYNVSGRALEKITKQWTIAQGAIPTALHPTPDALQPCSQRFTAQYGIPCSHTLLDRYNNKALSLVKEDFHLY
jgi:hypothetical protein